MEALFDSKLDGAFVIEFARRSVVIKLVNVLGKKPAARNSLNHPNTLSITALSLGVATLDML